MPSCSLNPEARPSPCPCPPQSGPMRPHVLICLCIYICAAELALSIHPTHASHFQTPQTRPAHTTQQQDAHPLPKTTRLLLPCPATPHSPPGASSPRQCRPSTCPGRDPPDEPACWGDRGCGASGGNDGAGGQRDDERPRGKSYSISVLIPFFCLAPMPSARYVWLV